MYQYGLLFCLCFAKVLPAQPVAVMLDKMNTVYIGVPNPLKVVVSDVPTDRLILKVSEGKLETTDSTNGQYQWTLYETSSKKAWLVLADSSFEHPIDTLVFRVNRLPEPYFRISSPIGNNYGGIYGTFDGYCSEYLRPIIESYDVTSILQGQDPVVKHNTGAKFNVEVLDYLKRIEPGCIVYFTNILWKGGFDATIRRSEQTLTFKPK